MPYCKSCGNCIGCIRGSSDGDKIQVFSVMVARRSPKPEMSVRFTQCLPGYNNRQPGLIGLYGKRMTGGFYILLRVVTYHRGDKKMKHLINLQMYGEGAEGAAAETGQVAAGTTADNGASQTQESKVLSFDDLIKGEYKEAYETKLKEHMDKRFKTSKETEQSLADATAQLEAVAPLISLLSDKYGVSDEADVNDVIQAVMDDDSYYEDEAYERGMSVADLKEIKKLERENAKMASEMEAVNRKKAQDEAFAKLVKDSENVKEFYPDFDLAKELENPNFGRLVVSGIDPKTAYEVVHKDEIITSAMKYTTQRATQDAVAAVASGSRIAENGLNGQAASQAKLDVSKLTKEQRAEIRRRVLERGEKVTLDNL